MKREMTLTVNGRDHQLTVKTHQSLLEVLRDHLSLFSVREGCGVGMCGSCTVLVDGKPMCACLLLPSQVVGKQLLTVEGLTQNGDLDFIQRAFVEATGFQCSFCTPGFILSARALLAEIPHASKEEIREYLAGNLCRCGSYNKILDAVMLAQKQMSNESGASVERREQP